MTNLDRWKPLARNVMDLLALDAHMGYAAYANHCAIQGRVPMSFHSWKRSDHAAALGDDPQRLYVIQTALNNAALSEAQWWHVRVAMAYMCDEHEMRTETRARIAGLGGAALSDDGAPGKQSEG